MLSFLSQFGLFLVISSLLKEGCFGLSPTLRGVWQWKKNTNFGNVDNWEGLTDENCSSNIFSFPEWMDKTVVSWPSAFIGKQIILPINAHFVFQPGSTTFSDQGKRDGNCQEPTEVKFRRTSRADWFDPNNWEIANSQTVSRGLNAVPHVERVPCQFDTVMFPTRSTFSLTIPQNVAIGQFLLGEETLTYTNIAIMMSSNVGKLQWHKESEVSFNLTNLACKDKDDVSCICQNYKPDIKQRICNLVQSSCPVLVDEDCHNPILPHGFCCPICGFHVKIKHAGGVNLESVGEKLKTLLPASASNRADYFVSRYSPRNAHVLLVPGKGKDSMDSAVNVLSGIVAFLKTRDGIEDVTWTGSWEHVSPDVDKWGSEGLSGATIAFIVIFTVAFLIGLLWFVYYRSNGRHPPLNLSTISGMVPAIPSFRVPSMQIPNLNLNLPGRRGSTQAGGRSFGFARFSNERVSTVNIGTTAANSVDSTMERGERVDDSIQPIDSSSIAKEKITEVPQDVGFSNVTYDLVGVHDEMELVPSSSQADKTDEASAMSTIMEAEGTATTAPPPPKPQRSGLLVDFGQEDEPVYSEVVDAIGNDDMAKNLIDEEEE